MPNEWIIKDLDLVPDDQMDDGGTAWTEQEFGVRLRPWPLREGQAWPTYDVTGPKENLERFRSEQLGEVDDEYIKIEAIGELNPSLDQVEGLAALLSREATRGTGIKDITAWMEPDYDNFLVQITDLNGIVSDYELGPDGKVVQESESIRPRWDGDSHEDSCDAHLTERESDCTCKDVS